MERPGSLLIVCENVLIAGVSYEAEHMELASGWDGGWQNAGWGMSNWTMPPPPPPSDSHVRSYHIFISSIAPSNEFLFLTLGFPGQLSLCG